MSQEPTEKSSLFFNKKKVEIKLGLERKYPQRVQKLLKSPEKLSLRELASQAKLIRIGSLNRLLLHRRWFFSVSSPVCSWEGSQGLTLVKGILEGEGRRSGGKNSTFRGEANILC